ncbi:MAG: hypothetical protein EXS68_01225, partial [Candidatus Ryanbacteria bacterium]|nr:hypothetical protein [Candidatus Ryanbacteria bacterium]
MISNKKLILFVLFVALQLLVIGGFFAQRLYTLSTGVQVVLRTVPVDPRDLIRGEYVALRYEISTISKYVAGNESFAIGDAVYVTLEKNSYEDIWRATQISKNQPTDYSIAIKGKVVSVPNTSADVWSQRASSIGVEYGIERYFVEAGKGKELERSGRLKVFVKVDRSGASVIERAEPTDSRGVDDWEL